MKCMQSMLLAAVLGASSLAATSAWADRGHGGGRYDRHHYEPPRHVYHHHDYRHRDNRALVLGTGLVLGSALAWAATRPPVVVYHEPAPVVMVPPPVYVAPPPPRDGWWYYCRSSEAYYPYARSCAGGWERVAPH